MLPRLLIGALALLALAAGTAQADSPRLTITDLGQPSAPVVVGQAPLVVSASGSCGMPFTLEASCPAGSWPALGTSWGPIEDVAGGDTLQLSYSSPVSGVSVASTTNYVPGTTTPSGEPVENRDVLTATAATPAANGWTITLPPLDPTALSGLTFSVVASDSAGAHDYALTIRTPRYADESKRCGAAYYSTGSGQYLCLSTLKGHPPVPPAPATVRLASASYATFAHGRLHLTITTPSGGTLHISLPHYRHVSALRHARAAGTLHVTLRLRHAHFSKAHHRVVVRLSLHRSSGALTRTQVVSVKY